MKTLVTGKVIENQSLNNQIYMLEVNVGTIVKEFKAGQFASIYVNSKEHILPRPISICDVNYGKESIIFVFAVVGKGTEILSKLQVANEVKLLLPLGNGFTIEKDKVKVGLVGGGIGIPPMNFLAKSILKEMPNAEVFGYFGYRDEVFLLDEFSNINVSVATDSGSYGFHGNVVQLMEKENRAFDIIYACGPKIMLKNLKDYCNKNKIKLIVSMEERMACSIGACVGCVVKINGEYKKVCVDGPVFQSSEVNFDE